MTAELGQAKLFDLPANHLTLNDRFLVPPFSVLEARAGYWKQRKAEWLRLGIKSELGRDGKLVGFEMLTDPNAPCPTCAGTGLADGGPRSCRNCGGNGLKFGGGNNGRNVGATSVFDPVVCEIAYRWFCPAGGVVLDPFAGGSVRGIVAAHLGLAYVGVDLRQEQIESNYEQAQSIGATFDWPQSPVWVRGDSASHRHPDDAFDLIFTCPPYYDLERYSDDPADLSNAADYGGFLDAYGRAISGALRALKPDRFAVVVVGEVRDKRGAYVGLVPDTIRLFQHHGAALYNEAILVTPLGSAPVRTSAQFGGGRKLGKTHQNVLVFVKGDPAAACAACPMPDEVAIEMGGATWRADGTATQGATVAAGLEPDVG